MDNLQLWSSLFFSCPEQLNRCLTHFFPNLWHFLATFYNVYNFRECLYFWWQFSFCNFDNWWHFLLLVIFYNVYKFFFCNFYQVWKFGQLRETLDRICNFTMFNNLHVSSFRKSTFAEQICSEYFCFRIGNRIGRRLVQVHCLK